MRIKVTSTHKTSGNVPVSSFFVSIAEFYIGVNTGVINLRTNVFTEDEDGKEYPFTLLSTDVLAPCLNQDLQVAEYATKTNNVSLQGTEYQVQAQLIFSLIFDKIAAANAENAGSIAYNLEGF